MGKGSGYGVHITARPAGQACSLLPLEGDPWATAPWDPLPRETHILPTPRTHPLQTQRP